MTAHPRVRKSIKWGGTILFALLVAVWLGSAFARLQWESASGQIVRIRGGLIEIVRVDGDLAPFTHFASEWSFELSKDSIHWWIARDWDQLQMATGGSMWRESTGIPLWFFALPLLIAAIVAGWHDLSPQERAVAGKCSQCGYDRAGIVADAPCPECGAAGRIAKV